MAYATAAEYRSHFSINATTGRYTDAALGDALTLASDVIDRELFRTFGIDSDEDDHEFVYDGEPFIVPDFAEVSAVDPDGTHRRFKRRSAEWPYNLVTWDADDRPARGDTVTITGKRGWSDVPTAIKMLTLEMAALWLLDGDRSRSQVAVVDEVETLTAAASGMLNRVRRAYEFPMQGYGVAAEA